MAGKASVTRWGRRGGKRVQDCWCFNLLFCLSLRRSGEGVPWPGSDRDEPDVDSTKRRSNQHKKKKNDGSV